MTIWVNVTTTAGWKQPPVGIVRVEQNVARALRDQLGEDRVRYCVWSARRCTFVEIPAASVSGQQMQAGIRGEPECLGTPPTLEPRATPRSIDASSKGNDRMGLRSLERYSRRLGYGIKHGIKRRFPGGAAIKRSLWRNSKKWVARGRATLDRLPLVPEAGKVRHRLQAGDILVTMGLEWETGYAAFLPALKAGAGIRIIGCCHDLIPIKYPHCCTRYVAEMFPEYLAQLTRACDAIACVSQCTLRDLRAEIERLDTKTPRLFTIRLGADLPGGAGEPSAVVASLTEERPYVLFVSTLEPRKNHEVLYRAFRRLAEVHGRDNLPQLVFIGAHGWGVNDFLHTIESDPVTKGVIVRLHQVTDNDLRVLYQKALFCVFPSLYEGWGLPVAEALGFGTPVICSDRGSLPEVGGDLVEYLDPWDLPAWVRAIERLWLDEDYRRRVADRIVREYCPDDWSAAGAEIGRVALELEGG